MTHSGPQHDGDSFVGAHADAETIRLAWASPVTGFSKLAAAALRTLQRAEAAEAIERALIARAEAAEAEVERLKALLPRPTNVRATGWQMAQMPLLSCAKCGAGFPAGTVHHCPSTPRLTPPPNAPWRQAEREGR